jgi:hypothetical protein
MIVLLAGGKNHCFYKFFSNVFLSGHLGRGLMLIMIILIYSIPIVVRSDCPLLSSFTNDTGVLFINKTTLIQTESIIHCQWLVIGSSYQVIQFYFVNFILI